MNSPFRSGYITLAGVPNAGKSSLVNALVRESVSIVTSKPQTTRKRTLGVLTDPEKYQMIFIDTPGVIESAEGLNPLLKRELDQALDDVDAVICTVGPWEFNTEKRPWAVELGQKILKETGKSPLYILTQIDRMKENSARMNPPSILTLWDKWFEGEAPPLLFTSSRTREGLNELKDLIFEKLPEGPKYYDVEIFTPQTMREIAAEVIRKHCFEQLHQELPYGLAVLIREFSEGEILKITADILVSRESHKPMVIGKGGLVLKQIGVRARFELERAFGKKIFLKLHVVAKPGWLKDKNYLQELGYENV